MTLCCVFLWAVFDEVEIISIHFEKYIVDAPIQIFLNYKYLLISNHNSYHETLLAVDGVFLEAYRKLHRGEQHPGTSPSLRAKVPLQSYDGSYDVV